MSPPYSRLKNKARKNTVRSSFLLALRFDPKDGVDRFLRNVGSISVAFRVLYTRKENPWENITFIGILAILTF
jgi:hypothetical protein